MDFVTEKIENRELAYRITDGNSSLIIDPQNRALVISENDEDYPLNHIISFDEFDKWVSEIDLGKQKFLIDIPYFADKEMLRFAIARYSSYGSERLSIGYTKRIYDTLVMIISPEYWTLSFLEEYNPVYLEGVRRITEALLANKYSGAVCEDLDTILDTSKTTYSESSAYIESVGKTLWHYRKDGEEYADISLLCNYATALHEMITEVKRSNNLNRQSQTSVNLEYAALIRYRILSGYYPDKIKDTCKQLIEFIPKKYFKINPDDMTEPMKSVIDYAFTHTHDKIDLIIWVSLLTGEKINTIIDYIERGLNDYGYSERETLNTLTDIYFYKHICNETSEIPDDIYEYSEQLKEIYNEMKNIESNNAISLFHKRYSNIVENQKCDGGYYFYIPKNLEDKNRLHNFVSKINPDIKEYNNIPTIIYFMDWLGRPMYATWYKYSEKGLGLKRINSISLLNYNVNNFDTLTKKELKILEDGLNNIEKIVCPII